MKDNINNIERHYNDNSNKNQVNLNHIKEIIHKGFSHVSIFEEINRSQVERFILNYNIDMEDLKTQNIELQNKLESISKSLEDLKDIKENINSINSILIKNLNK